MLSTVCLPPSLLRVLRLHNVHKHHLLLPEGKLNYYGKEGVTGEVCEGRLRGTTDEPLRGAWQCHCLSIIALGILRWYMWTLLQLPVSLQLSTPSLKLAIWRALTFRAVEERTEQSGRGHIGYSLWFSHGVVMGCGMSPGILVSCSLFMWCQNHCKDERSRALICFPGWSPTSGVK